MIRKLIACLVFALLLIPAARTTQAAPHPIAFTPVTARIVEIVNFHRVQAGLRPLSANATLMTVAQRFSTALAGQGRLSHRGSDGSTTDQRLTRAGYNWATYGECVAGGQATAELVVESWMKSPAHRSIILHARMTEIGIGHTWRDADPAGYGNYYVLDVANPR